MANSYLPLNRIGSLHVKRSDVIDLIRSSEFLMGMTEEEMKEIIDGMHMELNCRENSRG